MLTVLLPIYIILVILSTISLRRNCGVRTLQSFIASIFLPFSMSIYLATELISSLAASLVKFSLLLGGLSHDDILLGYLNKKLKEEEER